MADGGHIYRRNGCFVVLAQLDIEGNILTIFKKNPLSGLGGNAITRNVYRQTYGRTDRSDPNYKSSSGLCPEELIIKAQNVMPYHATKQICFGFLGLKMKHKTTIIMKNINVKHQNFSATKPGIHVGFKCLPWQQSNYRRSVLCTIWYVFLEVDFNIIAYKMWPVIYKRCPYVTSSL